MKKNLPKPLAFKLGLFLLLFCMPLARAQVVFKDSTQTAARIKPLMVKFGVNMGYTAPKELNNHIKQELSSVWAVSGSTDLNLYVAADAAVYIPLKEHWSVGPLLAGAIASRSMQEVSANMRTSVYSLWRLSPGLALQYAGQLQNAYWYISPAIQFHFLQYNSLIFGKSYDDQTAGLRLELGYATQGWSADVHYRLIATFMNPRGKDFEHPPLNFSGFALGVGVSFP